MSARLWQLLTSLPHCLSDPEELPPLRNSTTQCQPTVVSVSRRRCLHPSGTNMVLFGPSRPSAPKPSPTFENTSFGFACMIAHRHNDCWYNQAEATKGSRVCHGSSACQRNADIMLTTPAEDDTAAHFGNPLARSSLHAWATAHTRERCSCTHIQMHARRHMLFCAIHNQRP